MPIDHTSLPVPFSKVDDEVNFILAAFKHVGVKEFIRYPGVVGLGDDTAYLWISGIDEARQPIPDDVKLLRTHLALAVKDRAQVDAFHVAALNAGGKDNGPPGLRPQYHSNYYGAFVISPAGHNIEAVVNCPGKSAQ